MLQTPGTSTGQRRGATARRHQNVRCEIGDRKPVTPSRRREERVEPIMPTVWKTVLLLLCSNIFMIFAWYAHLRNLHDKTWYVAALASWSIALFEYLVQVPANRLGYRVRNMAQLKL